MPPVNERGIFVFPKEAGGSLAGREVTDHQIDLPLLVNWSCAPLIRAHHPDEADLVWAEVERRCEALGVTPPARETIRPSGPDAMPRTAPQRMAPVSAPAPEAPKVNGLLMPCGHPVSDLRPKPDSLKKSECLGCARIAWLHRDIYIMLDRELPGLLPDHPPDAGTPAYVAMVDLLTSWEQQVRNLT